MMEVSVQLNQMMFRAWPAPAVGYRRARYENKLLILQEVVYGADISGGNENIYNTWV